MGSLDRVVVLLRIDGGLYDSAWQMRYFPGHFWFENNIHESDICSSSTSALICNLSVKYQY